MQFKFKKIIACLMAMIMVIGIMPVTVFAAETIESGQCGDHVYWTLNDEGTLTISGEGDMWDYGYYSSYGHGPFYYSKSIKNVIIENGVTSIGDEAFKYCISLENIKISDSVTHIGDSAFVWCNRLKSVTIGNGLTTISRAAFSGCISLESIEIPDSVTNIGDSVFYDCTVLESIDVSENNLNYSSEDGVLFNKDKTTLIQYPIGNKRNEYIIPNSVTNIVHEAFTYCTSLTSIEIPDGVTSIGDYALHSCRNLESIEIPDSVTIIGNNAFSWCTSLESVTIGDSVTSIGNFAFSNCEKFKYVFYTNSEEEWNQIKVGSPNENLLNAYIHYNSTGHNKDDENVIKEATCTDKGEKAIRCSVCGFNMGTEEIEMTEHSYGEWTVTQEPTDTEDGEKQSVCSVCGDTKTETIPATGNTDSDSNSNDNGKFRCKMCPVYEANKDKPVIGLFYGFVHFFVHLAHRIGFFT